MGPCHVRRGGLLQVSSLGEHTKTLLNKDKKEEPGSRCPPAQESPRAEPHPVRVRGHPVAQERVPPRSAFKGTPFTSVTTVPSLMKDMVSMASLPALTCHDSVFWGFLFVSQATEEGKVSIKK